MGSVDPWDESDERAPRQAGWGCAIAAIIGSITTVIVIVLVIRLVASLAPNLPRP